MLQERLGPGVGEAQPGGAGAVAVDDGVAGGAQDVGAGALADGITFNFFRGDEVHASCTQLRAFFEERGQACVLRIPSNFRLTLASGKRLACADAVSQLLGRKHPELRSTGNGSKGSAGVAGRGSAPHPRSTTYLVMAAPAICAITAAH